MALMELSLLIVVLVAVLYHYLTRNFRYWDSRGVPSDKPVPLFGSFFDFAIGNISIGHKFEKLYKKYDAPYYGIYMINKPYLVLKDPEIIKNILIRDFHIFPNRYVSSDENADCVFASSLFATQQPQWKTRRSQMSPMFRVGKLKSMFPLIQDCVKDLQEHMVTVVDHNVEIKEITAKYTTDVLASCVFGVDANSFKSENSEFLAMGQKIFNFTMNRMCQMFCFFFFHECVSIFKLKFVEPSATIFLRKAFWESVHEREAKKYNGCSFLDMLMKLRNQDNSNNKLDGDRLAGQAINFFAAGFEPTNNAIVFTLYELCLNLQIQTRLRNEINTVLNKHYGVTFEAVNEMKYLHMVVSETLRKYPSLPFLTRCAVENYVIPQTGLIIEKATPVLISSHGLQSDPRYFPEPTKFDPEKFNDENKLKIPSCAYLPFGDGPRNCIGAQFAFMTVKLAIIYIIKDFLVKRTSATPVPIVYSVRTPVMNSEGGIPMFLQKL